MGGWRSHRVLHPFFITNKEVVGKFSFYYYNFKSKQHFYGRDCQNRS